MSRKPRFRLTDVPRHVVQRGNSRQAFFFNEADDRYYLDALANAARKFGGRAHACVLMTNHVHLLMTPDRNAVSSSIMQSVGRRYVRYVAKEDRRSGTLWEGRCRSSLIQGEGCLLACYRHLELNPVRADRLAHPAVYPW